MKKIFTFVLLTFFINLAFAEIKIGFVRVDQILKDAPQATESNKKLETEFKSRTEKLKKQISDLNENEKEVSIKNESICNSLSMTTKSNQFLDEIEIEKLKV